MKLIQLNKRQKEIIDIVKNNEPITGEHIAEQLGVTRSTLRYDLAILTMTGLLDARPKVGYFYTGLNKTNIFTEDIKNKKVEDVMSIPALAKKGDSVYDVMVTMFLSDVGSVIIIDENDRLCGIVSRKDLIKATTGGDINKIPVGMIMTRTPNIVTVKKGDSILDVTRKIVTHEIDSIPVIEKFSDDIHDIKVIGRISKTNITRLFLEIIDN